MEYGFILAFVVLGLMIGLVALGDANLQLWGDVNTKVRAASGS